MEQFVFTDAIYSDNTRAVFDLPIRMVDCIDPDIRICNLGALFAPDNTKGQQCFTRQILE